jgi:hypothetical protein
MLILSTPALAATLRMLGALHPEHTLGTPAGAPGGVRDLARSPLSGIPAGIVQPLATPEALAPHLLTPMYRVAGGSTEQEAASAARLVSDLAERLRRLAGAYGEWQQFEVEPYFDLFGEQAAMLVHVAERVSTVHVTFYADCLLPSFQVAVDYLAHELAPARFRNGAYPAAQAVMSGHWHHLVEVIEETRALLVHDAGFLAGNGAGEERSRWRRAWQLPTPAGLLPSLAPPLAATPTLTLSIEFPLPAARQPGRLRRLRRARQRQLRGGAHGKPAPPRSTGR